MSEMVHLGPFERFSGRDMRFGDLLCCRCAQGEGERQVLLGSLVVDGGFNGILANLGKCCFNIIMAGQ